MAGMTNSITDYIGIVKVDGTEYLTGSTLFGTCTTDANEAAKKVVIEEITNFTPTHGLTIHVLFTHTNTAASPTLQFSPESTATTYPIYAYGNSPVGDTLSTSWRDNAIVSFTFYDGALDQTATAKRWIMNSGTDTGADGLAAVNLVNVNNADDLKAIEALTKANGYLKKTAANTWALQTEQEASSTVAGITKIGASGGAATYEHTHGNIANDGTLGSTASQAVVTDANKKITTTSLAVTDNTTVGTTATKFVAKVTQNAQGKITVTKADLPEASTTAKGIIQIGDDANQALAGNSQITIAGNTVNLAGGSLEAATLRESLKLSAALRFMGSVANDSSYKPGDGTTGKPILTGVSNYTPIVGDVILSTDGDAEYVCIAVGGTTSNPTYTWERLGRDGSFALTDEVILKSLTSTAGDMIYASSAKNPARLAIGTANTFLKSDGSKPVWTTINNTTVGLGNVTNEAQIPKSIGTTAGDIIYWSSANTPVRLEKGSAGQVLTIDNDTNLPVWATNAATDKRVEQKKYTSNTNSEFRLLFKKTANNTDETNLVYYSDIENKNITYNPSTGALSAAKFIGALRAEDVKTALDYASTTANTTLSFLHKSGAWKTISVGVGAENANGNVVTNVTQSAGTKPNFTQGTLATASVSNGVLTLISATTNTFNAGAFPTLTVTKANVTISAANT